MTDEAEKWVSGVRAGLLNVLTLYGYERAQKAAVVMAPSTASRGLLLCGFTELADLEGAVGRRIFLDCSMPHGEVLIIDGERYAKSTV